MKTTLNKIKAHDPCKAGWAELLAYLGKTEADDEPLGIETIIESNGIEDALWALRAVEGHDREIRLFATWCARQVQHLMKDTRSLAALDVAERFANGQATEDELEEARKGADAAADAADADAAYYAALAAEDAADTAARAAARAAANAAYYASAFVVRKAVDNAIREPQKRELLRICKENEK